VQLFDNHPIGWTKNLFGPEFGIIGDEVLSGTIAVHISVHTAAGTNSIWY
jgi:hypothetical protein